MSFTWNQINDDAECREPPDDSKDCPARFAAKGNHCKGGIRTGDKQIN